MEKTKPGIYTAALTPMKEDLSFNGDLLVSHCRELLDSGATGIAVLGTTGEANSFTLSEKKQIIDRVTASGIPPDKLMIGTGTCAYPETVELTKYVLNSGVKDVLMLPPYYYKQISDEGLQDYFERVIDSVADESLRIILYHFPKMSGIDMSHNLIGRLLEKYPGQITGMKDSSGDLDHMKSVCLNFPDIQLFAGTERYLLPVLRAGGAGCISATANVTISQIAKVYRSWQNQDADKLQEELNALRSVFDGHPFTAILKQFMAYRNDQPEWLPLRPPNSPVSPAVLNGLVQELADLGFMATVTSK